MHKASWVFLLAVSLMLTAGCKKDELQAKDARIAELESQGQATGTSLDQCKKDRENLNKLVKGYTGEINSMEAALADAVCFRFLGEAPLPTLKAGGIIPALGGKGRRGGDEDDEACGAERHQPGLQDTQKMGLRFEDLRHKGLPF